jgi:imidazolonepropionase
MAENQSQSDHWDSLWFNARLATMRDNATPYGMCQDDAIAVTDGRIRWIGKTADITAEQRSHCRHETDCRGNLVTPGLIDCHTHLVYGGDRVKEFEMRLGGASYSQIARGGGGIAATVSATRASTANSLYNSARSRLQSFLDEGVTTVEIKSGYGLELQSELKMLSTARRLGEQLPVDVVTSFLGAHATPPEFQGADNAYIDEVCNVMLPVVAANKLADSVDAFCENIAFSTQQVARVFAAAKAHDLTIKLHAEQLSDQKGAVMAARMGALSVDHIEYLAEEDVAVLRDHGTVAVLLPGAFYFLGETTVPPIAALREHGVPMAIASDSNPGSSPVSSLLLMLNMACTVFKLTPEESLAGVTRNAARALGLDEDIGTLEVGKIANMVLWNLSNPAGLSYGIGHNPCQSVMYRGVLR